MASRFSLLLIVLVTATGCYAARPDARIRPGFHGGVAVSVLHTPDAKIFNNDASAVGRPEHEDAANTRAVAEPSLGYGWSHVDLTLRVLAGMFVPGGEGGEDPMRPGLLPSLDLYVLALHRGGWAVGLGLEGPGGILRLGGGYVVLTRELSPLHSLTLTGRFSSGASQAQLAYVLAGENIDLALTAGIVVPLDATVDLTPCPESCQEVNTPTFALFGLQFVAF